MVAGGLGEAGASPALTKCLTEDLDDHLTEADAEKAYDDVASEPEVSEAALSRVSLLEKGVKERLMSRARGCEASLVSHGQATRGEVTRMLYLVGRRAYRGPQLLLEMASRRP